MRFLSLSRRAVRRFFSLLPLGHPPPDHFSLPGGRKLFLNLHYLFCLALRLVGFLDFRCALLSKRGGGWDGLPSIADHTTVFPPPSFFFERPLPPPNGRGTPVHPPDQSSFFSLGLALLFKRRASLRPGRASGVCLVPQLPLWSSFFLFCSELNAAKPAADVFEFIGHSLRGSSPPL